MTREDLTTIAGHAFIVTDRLGDIAPGSDRGLFFSDTRLLSSYELRIEAAVPLLLRSDSIDRDSAHVYATNVAVGSIPDHTLALRRFRKLGESFREEITLTNHGREPASLGLSIAIDADFADIFEVRSFLVDKTVHRIEVQHSERELTYSDHTSTGERQAHIIFSVQPSSFSSQLAEFQIDLDPNSTWSLEIEVAWVQPNARTALPIPTQRPIRDSALADPFRDAPTLETGDRNLLLAYNRSIRDLETLQFALNSGESIPAAGVPWFLAIFGRDSIITSLQALPFTPRLARGTLRTLASYQATSDNAFRDAEPGKMPHEIRFGALAQSDSVPHARYYGTADATPLWLILLGAYHDWTGDRELIQDLLPAAKNALRWIDEFGDFDGDGFVEYQRRSPQGLVNQGWKDSWDGIQFADGQLAEPPIALIEVQGYVCAAKRAMARLYDILGFEAEAASLRAEAARLRIQVDQSFWMPEKSCYAVALDGRKRQVDSIASNQGHLLWCGLPEEDRARHVTEQLMSPDVFSGWGIRTLARSMTGYNPIGYHLGTVWPHDTALIADGFARYGFDREASTLANALIEASRWFEGHSLPELFCGYDRAETPFPVDYPVACSPQAWAAGATLMLVSMLAGLTPDDRELRVKPMHGGPELRLSNVPYRGDRYIVDTRSSSAVARGP